MFNKWKYPSASHSSLCQPHLYASPTPEFAPNVQTAMHAIEQKGHHCRDPGHSFLPATNIFIDFGSHNLWSTTKCHFPWHLYWNIQCSWAFTFPTLVSFLLCQTKNARKLWLLLYSGIYFPGNIWVFQVLSQTNKQTKKCDNCLRIISNYGSIILLCTYRLSILGTKIDEFHIKKMEFYMQILLY